MNSGGTGAGKKTSEIDEIRHILRNPQGEEDLLKKRQALRKVVALMTSGIDTSALFPDVIMACFTQDTVSKKLIYLYLSTESRGKEELATLTINAMVKECRDQNPVVRGFALRAFAAMHVADLLDYLLPVLDNALGDSSAYVRKTAVCCLLRLYYQAPQEFAEQGYLSRIQQLLGDADPIVSSNALEALLEINSHGRIQIDSPSGTFVAPLVVTKGLLYQMLNRLRNLGEWQQLQVINLVMQYTPASEEEMFDVMNLLDEHLQRNHSGLVVACANVFLHLTENAPAVQKLVYKRLRQPLLTVISGGTVETAYAALCHVKLLTKREPQLFAGDFRVFFCHTHELSYVKVIKMEILTNLALPSSYAPIITELVAYTEDRSASVACKAIACLGQLSLQLPETLKPVLAHFADFVNLKLDDLRGATLLVLKDVLRQHSAMDTIRPVLDAIVRCFMEGPFADTDSRCVFVWVLGEFGEYIEEAPYLMETVSQQLSKEPPPLQLQLLSSAVQLFFKRPPEMNSFIKSLFRTMLASYSNADVLDQTLFYYRLLKADMHAAKQALCSSKAPVQRFMEDTDAGTLDQLFEEFDTFSVIYGIPRGKFVASDNVSPEAEEEGDSNDSAEEEEAEWSGESAEEGASPDARAVAGVHGAAPPVSTAASSDLFPALDSLSPSTGGVITLDPDVELDAAEFQRRWAAASDLERGSCKATRHNAESLVDALEIANIFLLASGNDNDGRQKFFFYALESTLHVCYLLELLLDSSGGDVTFTVKSDAGSAASSSSAIRFIHLLKTTILGGSSGY